MKGPQRSSNPNFSLWKLETESKTSRILSKAAVLAMAGPTSYLQLRFAESKVQRSPPNCILPLFPFL